MKAIAQRKKTLHRRLAELDARVHGIEAELETHDTEDLEELAVEREDDEVLEGMGSTGLQEITAIRAALDRIADGSYGICVKCGDKITEDRLDLLPATPFCRRCAV